MNVKVLFHEAAERELYEAADFYDLASPELGLIFLDEIRHAIRKISESPESAPLIRSRIRKRRITKFPYSVIYSMHSDEIRILAIAHQKRRPFYWRSRR
jgi:plasmid stabilization system protein ParE